MFTKDLIISVMLEKLEEKVTNPYAVGMAAAMKATGDEPPLKKSTITKAHKIAKSIEKNEEVELDEADAVVTHKWYSVKHWKDGSDHFDNLDDHLHGHEYKHAALGNTARKRPDHHIGIPVKAKAAIAYMDKNAKPVNESLELDEISQEKLRDYHAAAGADRLKAKSQVEKGMAQKKFTPASVQKTTDAYKRFIKRGKGMTAAANKMDEEAEDLSEAYYVTKGLTQTHDKPFKSSTAAIAHANKEEDRTGRTHTVTHVKDGKIHRQWQYSPDHKGYASYTDYKGEDARSHGIKESVEQIDEISKALLGRYIKKAKTNVAGQAYQLGAKDPLKPKASWSKALGREKHIDKAVDRLTKEEVEQIDEVSNTLLQRYKTGAIKDIDQEHKTEKRSKGYALASKKLTDRILSDLKNKE